MPAQAKTMQALHRKLLDDQERSTSVSATTWHKEGRTFALTIVSLGFLQRIRSNPESELPPIARCRTVYRYDDLPVDRRCDDVDRVLHNLHLSDRVYWCDDGERISNRVRDAALAMHDDVIAGYSERKQSDINSFSLSNPCSVINRGEELLSDLTLEDVSGNDLLELNRFLDSFDTVNVIFDRAKALNSKLRNRR